MGHCHKIEIFSIKPVSVKTDGIDTTICYLDELELVEAEISDASEDTISEKMQAKEESLLQAMQCQYQASIYGIEKLPAIVIDDQYIAYGVDSVSKALSLLESRGEVHA